MRAVVLALGLCGCDFIFTLKDPSELPSDDAPHADGPRLDSTLPDARPCMLDCPTTYGDLGFGVPTSKYLVVDGPPIQFADAQLGCIATRDTATSFTHLLVLDDIDEFNRVRTASIDDSVPFWIGHKRTQLQGAFEPVSAQPYNFPPLTGAPWASGQPDINNCAAIDVGTTALTALSCLTMHSYICECDCFAPD